MPAMQNKEDRACCCYCYVCGCGCGCGCGRRRRPRRPCGRLGSTGAAPVADWGRQGNVTPAAPALAPAPAAVPAATPALGAGQRGGARVFCVELRVAL
jgi:hypothetical protein